jgi:hypothetical protein
MPFAHAVQSALSGGLQKVREINRRYAKPRIQMSPAVRVALLVLRIYLFVLVGLLIYKFYTVVTL